MGQRLWVDARGGPAVNDGPTCSAKSPLKRTPEPFRRAPFTGLAAERVGPSFRAGCQRCRTAADLFGPIRFRRGSLFQLRFDPLQALCHRAVGVVLLLIANISANPIEIRGAERHHSI